MGWVITDYLLALAQKGHADFLVTGDKNDLLSLTRHAGTAIVTVREMLVTPGLRTI
jgi:predicted nucleic acid-binding protein